jgi:NADH:ubiquinone oxidoreductase subunit F (NADH-binding)
MSTLVATAPVGLLAGWRATHRTDLATHIQAYGPLPGGGPGWADAFIRIVHDSGLAGRGGAGFPAARKLAGTAARAGSPVLVVNAMEGEPASAKDRVLLLCAPHLVLDGAELAASALGAARIVVCVPAQHDDVAASVASANRERVGTNFAPVAVDVVRPPGRYLAGEESALVDWINGRTGVPTFRPDKSVGLRLRNGPAIVHNTETLASMALVARYGADAANTALVTVSGGVERPGVYEIAMGMSLSQIVDRAGPVDMVAAVLLGGYGGTWIGAHRLDIALAPKPPGACGPSPGAGVVVVLPSSSCPLAEVARITAYMADQSAGQCGPCVFGLSAIAADMGVLADAGDDVSVVERLGRRLATVRGRGACGHPDGVVRMVASALDVFADDVALHVSGRPCSRHDRPTVLTFPTV